MHCYKNKHPTDTPAEEAANTVTHGIGAVASVFALVLLVVWAARGGDPMRIVTLSIFGVTLVAVYFISTMYHLCPQPTIKRWLRVCDHVAIYLLIAGTYTPFMLVTLGGEWGWSLFGVIWGLAAAGVCLRVLFIGQFEGLALALYLVMGWLALVGAPAVFGALSETGLAWVLAGGAAYTLGVVFYLWNRLSFNHAIWHLFVMAGSTCHVLAMFTDVLPLG